MKHNSLSEMRRTIASLFAPAMCLFAFGVHGQQPGGNMGMPNFTGHSPNATALGQYGVYPVDMSTGVPKIEVPLYTINTGKLTLPLKLTYHASGIKANEQASYVGLGWALQAGGQIIKIVRDQPDDGGWPTFWQTGDTIPNFNPIDGTFEAMNAVGNTAQLRAWANVDKEPDQYIVSVSNGAYGLFCLNNSGQYVAEDYNNMKFEASPTNISISAIVVRDERGVVYRFGKNLSNVEAFERTTKVHSTVTPSGGPAQDMPHESSKSYTSTWHLTEMISPDLSDTIRFEYETVHYSDEQIVGYTKYMINDGILPPTDHVGANFNGEARTSANTTIANTRVLSKIIFKDGYIDLFNTHDRQDMSASITTNLRIPRIHQLRVYAKNGTLLKRIDLLNNSYFNRTGNGLYLAGGWSSPPSYFQKSLKLDGVKFYNGENGFVNEYQFEYDATPLPVRGSSAVDHWGYYNGKNNPATLIPETFFVGSNGRPTLVGTNRASDYNFMKAATLTKVIYPTKGYTQYQFEANRYLNVNQQESQVEKTRTVRLYAVNRLPECDDYGFLPGIPVNNSVDFEVTEEVSTSGTPSVNADITIMLSSFQVAGTGPMQVRILKNGALQTSEIHYPSTQNKVVNKQLLVHQGDEIRIEASTNGATGSVTSICNSPYIEVTMRYNYWETTGSTEINPEQAGGLRVKSISDYDHTNALIGRRNYTYGYNEYGANGVGVGKLISDPNRNFFRYPLLYAISPGSKALRNLIWFTANSQVELGSNRGIPVIYDVVTETRVSATNASENGKTEYLYSGLYSHHEPLSSFKYPFNNTSYYPDWVSNVLQKIKHYKQQGTGYQLAREVTYSNLVIESRIKTLKLHQYQPDIYSGTYSTANNSWIYQMNNPSRFMYYNYIISAGTKVKTQEVITDYVNGVAATSKTIIYHYANHAHMKPSAIKESQSDGSWQVTYTAYPQDYSNTTGFIGEMKSKHLIGYPIEQVKYKEVGSTRTILSGNITAYKTGGKGQVDQVLQLETVSPVALASFKFSNRALGQLAPSGSLAAYAPDSRYKQRLVYNTYDTRSNPRQLTVTSGPSTVYLWSYNAQYPIAEIRNATFADVATVLGGTTAVNNFAAIANPSDAQVIAFLAPLRTAASLKGALITTYTHRLLFGMTRQTDASGLTTHYDYDSLGRLKAVRDHYRNIVEEYQYNYRQ